MTAVQTRLLTGASALDTASKVVDPQGPYLTLYVLSSAGVTAGAVDLEASPDGANWSQVATVTTDAASTLFKAAATEAHRRLRVRISTAIVGGTVEGWVVTAPPAFAGVDERDLS